MLFSLSKNQVDYVGKSSSQTDSLRWQNGNISWSLFNRKSPLDRNKSHLCVCRISYWYFESPVALVSWYDQVFLLPWTRLTPCTIPLTHVYLVGQQRNHSCFVRSPWRGTALIAYPSKGTNCHREVTLEFLAPGWQNILAKRKKNGNSDQSPFSLLCPSWCIISM